MRRRTRERPVVLSARSVQTDRQTERETDRQTDKQTDKQTNKIFPPVGTFVASRFCTYRSFLADLLVPSPRGRDDDDDDMID